MDDEIAAMCRECGSKCCRYFCFQIDAPDTFEEFEDIRWFLLHEGISVHVDEGDWYISIANRCKALTADGRCRIYEDRPLICRRYSMDDCDHTRGDYEYEELFETPEDLDRYARKFLGEQAYRKARDKAFAKHARKETARGREEGDSGKRRGRTTARAEAAKPAWAATT